MLERFHKIFLLSCSCNVSTKKRDLHVILSICKMVYMLEFLDKCCEVLVEYGALGLCFELFMMWVEELRLV